MQQSLAFIPSPSQGSIHLGPLPLRGYALMIIVGVIVAVWLGERRWVARGGEPGTVLDIAVWAVPFGLIGGRLYHVITDHQLYFGHGRHPVDAFKVWNGGLGIWGAIAVGALGAYLGCRRRGISLRVFADAAAPGIVLAQAIGRWGNWFNQELYGKPTTLPWAVKIDAAHRPAKTPDLATYQPTFLYECLWCVGVAILVIWAEKRFRLAYGRTFALYVAAYTLGRAWIEWLRVDEAHHILGLRLNDWTSLIVFLGAVAYLYVNRDKTENPPGALGTVADVPERPTEPAAAGDEPAAGDEAVPAATADPADAEDSSAAEPETTRPTDQPDEPAAPEDARSTDEPAEPEGTSPASEGDGDLAPAGRESEAAPGGGDRTTDADASQRLDADGTADDSPADGTAHAQADTAPSSPTDPETAQEEAADDGDPRPATGAAERTSPNGESDDATDATDATDGTDRRRRLRARDGAVSGTGDAPVD
jgi:prolipoprotein diacylglyceryl transferase